MAKDRIVIPGIPTDAARVIIDRMREQDERLALLERKAGRPGIVTADVAAKVGEFLNIEGPAELITVILPEATQARRNARITLAFRNDNPVRIVAVNGTVNRVPFVLNNLPGTYDAISDGLGGWSVQVGVTEDGVIGTPGAPGALADIADQRVLGNDAGFTAVPTPITVHQELDWIPGAGTRWVFDGVDDRADFGNINGFERTDVFSLGAWTAVTPAVGAFHDIFVKFDGSRGFSMYVSSTNKVGLFMTNGGLNTLQVETTAAIDGAPHQLLITYDGTSAAAGVTIYIDGVSVALTTVDTPITATMVNAANFAVGCRDTGVGSPFAGVLFETAAWGAELTAAQVLETYAGGVPPDLTALATAPDPVFWAKFDDLDVVGANGIINYGTGAQPGTAEGGLTKAASGIGGIPVRATSIWGLLNPGATDLPVLSNGTTAIPSYRALPNAGLAPMAANTYKGNATGSTAAPQDVAISGLAGAGMTATGSALNVIGSTSITVNANDVQRPALTGFAAASANSNATTSAEPIVTYSASANMSAERVLSSSTSNTADTSVASQIQVRSAAKTGDVTCPANDNVQTIANDAVTNVKAANMAANSVKANPTTGSADPQDLAIGTHEIVARAAGNVAGIAVGSDTGVANIREGNVSTGLGAQPRDEMHRWLASTPNVSVFEEEFQGNLAAMSARFTATAGFTLSASATANAEIWGLLGITQAVGSVAGALTLGASESANCFRHEKVRYICLVVRNSTGITADTAFAVGLVGPFDVYGAGLQGRIAGTSEGRFFSYDTALSANWHCGYRSGSATSSTDSGVAAANLTRYVFEWFQSDAGAVQMYVNGDLVRNDGAGNGPAAGECTFFLSSLGSTAAARTWQFDYIKVVSQSANRFGG